MGRPLKNLPNKQVIRMITRIRSRNNRQWMALLALAFASHPRKARTIMQQITLNDRIITKWSSRLH